MNLDADDEEEVPKATSKARAKKAARQAITPFPMDLSEVSFERIKTPSPTK
jgi:hypothetical protein